MKLSTAHTYYVTSNTAMARIRKDVVVTQFDILAQHLFGRAEESLEVEFKISNLRAEI
jgi:hypothetical protein